MRLTVAKVKINRYVLNCKQIPIRDFSCSLIKSKLCKTNNVFVNSSHFVDISCFMSKPFFFICPFYEFEGSSFFNSVFYFSLFVQGDDFARTVHCSKIFVSSSERFVIVGTVA